jgi:acyl-CoA synthetase (AMP-forming)/AMP-acid ligase II
MIARDDEHTALHEPQSGMRISYAELHEAIADCAGRLAFVGVSAGDRVGLSFPNSISFLVTFLAVVELGAAAAPLNGALGEREVAEELTDLAATRLIYAAANTAAASAARTLGIPTNMISVVGNRIEVEHATGLAVAESSDAESIALLLHTSGTTSRPKTVPIRQRNLSASTATIVATYGLNGDDITYCVMPLFHVRRP